MAEATTVGKWFAASAPATKMIQWVPSNDRGRALLGAMESLSLYAEGSTARTLDGFWDCRRVGAQADGGR